jgi:hypothetical protein
MANSQKRNASRIIAVLSPSGIFSSQLQILKAFRPPKFKRIFQDWP